ncbi:ABC-F family ATP-binding cassette domain-containing protein [Streptomyces avicenniae]|uniref:ABC-F family ATP-binding cassette domain-containing protein n=1 Tax=Streptomyces avicenniae TaxID=500153 RepID=UPI00069AB82D|nr:ATP-binding cassette domain-containing protein [Streptomyces avicenniae]
MGHIEIAGVHYSLPDGRPLLSDVSLRVGDGHRTALVGPNGAGKTTLLRIVAGDVAPHEGAVTRSGALGVMPQNVGDDCPLVRDLLLSLAPPAVRAAARALDAAELAMMEADDEPTQLAYAQAISDWGDAQGYEAEVLWDVCCQAALGIPWERARWREVASLSGGERKRLALEALLRGPHEVLMLDEPDNALDVPGKRWLEDRLTESPKAVLLVSHDRELLARTATRIATLEPGAAGAGLWVHGGGFGTYAEGRAERMSRLEELRRRWDEEHAKLRQLVLTLGQKAKFNDGMASRYQAAQTRLRRFEEAGPPEEVPVTQRLGMRLRGGRTGKRSIVCTGLALPGLVQPFDLEVHFGDRVVVTGPNGSGKSHLLRLLALGGTDPDQEHQPVGDELPEPVAATGVARLGARVRPGWFRQSSATAKRSEKLTLLEVLHRGEGPRQGMPREEASRALDRYGLAKSAEQRIANLSGGQRARFRILLLELSGATLLLLDEPTDNLDLVSAEALEDALGLFEGTIVAVTHDRWFARSFNRHLFLRDNGSLVETDEPVWDDRAMSGATKGR